MASGSSILMIEVEHRLIALVISGNPAKFLELVIQQSGVLHLNFKLQPGRHAIDKAGDLLHARRHPLNIKILSGVARQVQWCGWRDSSRKCGACVHLVSFWLVLLVSANAIARSASASRLCGVRLIVIPKRL